VQDLDITVLAVWRMPDNSDDAVDVRAVPTRVPSGAPAIETDVHVDVPRSGEQPTLATTATNIEGRKVDVWVKGISWTGTESVEFYVTQPFGAPGDLRSAQPVKLAEHGIHYLNGLKMEVKSITASSASAPARIDLAITPAPWQPDPTSAP
jgi:hypothetical protein